MTERMTVEQYRRLPQRKRSKYGNKKIVIDGIEFHSKLEGKEYQELKLREKAGELRNIETQKRFDIVVDCNKICTYIADFVYVQVKVGFADSPTIHDSKGHRTAVFNLKWKLMQALYPDFIFVLTEPKRKKKKCKHTQAPSTQSKVRARTPLEPVYTPKWPPRSKNSP